MENKAHALIAGLFTIVLVVAAIAAATWFSRDHSERVSYQIATRLTVPGLNAQAAVRYRGLDVGRVDDIRFDPAVPGQILMQLSVKPDTPVTHSTFGTLGYQGVTGIAYVELDDDGSNPVRVAPNARIELRPGLLDTLQIRGLAILDKTDMLAQRFNALLAPENKNALMQAIAKVDKAATEIETMPREMQPTLAQLPKLSHDASKALASIDALSSNVNALVSKLQSKDGAVDRLTVALDRVGAAADKIERETLPLTQELRSSMRSIDRTLDRLNDRPQSILFGSSAAPGPGEAGYKDR